MFVATKNRCFKTTHDLYLTLIKWFVPKCNQSVCNAQHQKCNLNKCIITTTKNVMFQHVCGFAETHTNKLYSGDWVAKRLSLFVRAVADFAGTVCLCLMG